VNAVAVIPARWDSTRFPGKPLADIAGRPMIARVAAAALAAERVTRVIVATDDERIAAAGREAGAEAVLTRGDHATGTDRVAEAVSGLDAPVVLNLQGDVPLLAPGDVDRLAAAFDDPEVSVATLGVRGATAEELANPRAAKIVRDDAGNALYFSRAPIPYRHVEGGVPPLGPGEREPEAWIHVGIYGFRREVLDRLVREPRSGLEAVEDLEQLRALRMGFRIRVVEVEAVPIGVDVPDDVKRVESVLRSRSEGVTR
jgi:3-deoxy-manno-octulosonate cytidylyltransferase (CMP-KDO synthetase)